ncbi:hypothetical protein ACLI1A_03405 [Flavobacterium sp. RHBU_3]
MLANQNQRYEHEDELPNGMFVKMLAVSIGSVVGACLLGLAFFSM